VRDAREYAISGMRTKESANKQLEEKRYVQPKPVVTLESTIGDMDGNKVVDVADALSEVIFRLYIKKSLIFVRKKSKLAQKQVTFKNKYSFF